MGAKKATRRRIGVLAALAVLIALLCGLGLAAARWAPTDDAFQSVWLPLASRLTGVELEAERVTLEPDGRILLQAPRVRWDKGAFAADEVEAFVVVEELGFDEVARFRSVRGRAIELTLRVESSSRRIVAWPAFLGWLAIEEAELEGQLAIERDGRLWVSLEDASLELRDARSGETGRLVGTAALAVHEPASQSGRGRIELDVALDMPDDLSRAIAARGRLDAIRLEAPRGSVALAIGGDVEARIHPDGVVDVDRSSTVLRDGETQLAHVEATGRIARGVPDLAGHVAIERPPIVLPAFGVELPHALAALLAPARFDSRFTYDGRRLGLDGGLAGLDLGAARTGSLLLEGALRLEGGGATIDGLRCRVLDEAGAEESSFRLAGNVAPDFGPGSTLDLDPLRSELAPWLPLLLPDRAWDMAQLPVEGSLHVARTDAPGWRIESDVEVELPGEADAEGLPGAPVRWHVQSELDEGAGTLEGVIALEGPNAAGDARGTGRLELAWSPRPTRLALTADSLDLTSWLDAWPERVFETPPQAGDPEAPPILTADVRFEEVRMRSLRAGRGRVVFEQWPDRLRIAIRPARLYDGRLEGSLERSGAGDAHWTIELTGTDHDASLLLPPPTAEEPRELTGRLSIHAALEGFVPEGDELYDHLDGRLSFLLQDGSVAEFHSLQTIAKETGFNVFRRLELDELRGRFPVEAGRLLVDELPIDGGVAHLIAAGRIGLRDVDMTLNPRLGPELAQDVPTAVAKGLMATANGLFALPLVVRVEGDWPEPEIRTRAAPAGYLAGVYRGIFGTPGRPGAGVLLRPFRRDRAEESEPEPEPGSADPLPGEDS